MTYADQLGVIGDEVAGKIAAITTNPPDVVHAAAGRALGSQWDADLAAAVPPPPPPPPPTTILVGASPGAWGSTGAMVAALGLKPVNIVRAFNPADAKGVPAGCGLAYSNDGGHNRGADLDGLKVGSAAYSAWLSELHAAFPRDDAPGWVIADHEFDIHGNDYAKTAREYTGLGLLLDALNAGRTHKVERAVVTTGMVYDTSAYQNLGQVPCEVIGADNYARKHWDTLAGYAKRIGRKSGCFENGIKAQTNPSTFTDQQVADAMTADFNQAKALGFEVFCYWPNGGNDLTHRPISTKTLAGICATNR